jgi:flagellar basal body-associated protein FliL
MSEPYNALNPEDIGLLVGLAGPLYAESKMIDSMTGIQPTTGGGYGIGGADTIKRGLENIVQTAVRTPTPPSFQPPPQYIHPPEVHQIPLPITNYYESTPTTAIDYGYGPSKQDDSQLEFNFNLTEQKKTNELLEKNNKLLQKLISLLESKDKDEPVKLKTELKGVQSILTKPVQNK